MRSKDAGTYNRDGWASALAPARGVLRIIRPDRTLELRNDARRGDGRDRQAPQALQVKPGAGWSQALRVMAQRGDESVKRVLRAFDSTLSGVIASDIAPVLRKFAPHDRNLRHRIPADTGATSRKHALLHRARRFLEGLPLQHAEVDVSKLVSDVVDMLSGVALEHGVRLDHSLAQDRQRVIGDDRQLGEMLIALILHALTLTLHARRELRSIHITTTGTSDTVEIYVENESPESFGVGLGMPLARRIAEAHGGSLTTRHLGQSGFSIQVTLPRLW